VLHRSLVEYDTATRGYDMACQVQRADDPGFQANEAANAILVEDALQFFLAMLLDQPVSIKQGPVQ